MENQVKQFDNKCRLISTLLMESIVKFFLQVEYEAKWIW